jgi:3-deoxy-D-manno-octulosonic-acid transferase
MYLLYSLLTAAGIILLSPYFFLRGLRTGKYVHNVRERLGYFPAGFAGSRAGAPQAIWVHAVSVGEALAALPLARRLKEQFPGRPLYVSTTTATGQQLARERMDFADGVFYFPLDWAGPVRRALRAVNPALVVVLETEIWPNFLRECRRAGVPVVFVNGRISDRSFGRYRLANALTGGFLGRVLKDAEEFLMQSEEDARRLRSLGAPAERVIAAGNLKYDLAPPRDTPLVTWLEEQAENLKRRPVVVAGSVVEGEERAVLDAFAAVRHRRPQALLILAPRKPERFDGAERVASAAGWNVLRRSRAAVDKPLGEDTEIVLLDTLGELAGLYRLADLVFVGGSLVPVGGHNILEAAAFGKPPVFGPHMQNFREMAERFLAANAALQVQSGEELGKAWLRLLDDATLRESMGRAALQIVDESGGATDRAMARIAAILGRSRSAA